MLDFDDVFGSMPIMAILRAVGLEKSLELSKKAWDLGITLVEITIQSDEDLHVLSAVSEAAKDRNLIVGAGTVTSAGSIPSLRAAGAAFTVSPGFDIGVVRASLDAGMPSLPGVATGTEVQHAKAAGLSWVKAFPANHLGPGWFKTMAGPFPEMNFIATGGMDAYNAPDYLRAGVRCVAVGSALGDPTQLDLLSSLLPT